MPASDPAWRTLRGGPQEGGNMAAAAAAAEAAAAAAVESACAEAAGGGDTLEAGAAPHVRATLSASAATTMLQPSTGTYDSTRMRRGGGWIGPWSVARGS
eukprot:358864-Chlamydomonas_euryale.AAC.6